MLAFNVCFLGSFGLNWYFMRKVFCCYGILKFWIPLEVGAVITHPPQVFRRALWDWDIAVYETTLNQISLTLKSMPLISNFCILILPAVQWHRFIEAAANINFLWPATVLIVPAEIGGHTVGRRWMEFRVIYFRYQGKTYISVGKNIGK